MIMLPSGAPPACENATTSCQNRPPTPRRPSRVIRAALRVLLSSISSYVVLGLPSLGGGHRRRSLAVRRAEAPPPAVSLTGRPRSKEVVGFRNSCWLSTLAGQGCFTSICLAPGIVASPRPGWNRAPLLHEALPG